MKKHIPVIIAVVVMFIALVWVIMVKGTSLTGPSSNSASSVLSGFSVDRSYRYENLGPGKEIGGVKFTIPQSMATGTNLGPDSYISVEKIPMSQMGVTQTGARKCSAALFLYPTTADAKGTIATTVNDGGTTYSVASSSDAAAGNRYDETVYAVPGTNPCMAVRYFIHYAVFENYPPGTVRRFDEQALIKQFDQIRRALVTTQ